jgi:hypothetical protein
MRVTAAAAAVAVMTIAQLVIFRALGVYRTAWFMTDVTGFGVLLRACAIGTTVGYLALRMLALPAGGDAAVVHFLLLLPVVTLTRFSHAMLTQARRAGTPERALICGTSAEAQHVLARLRGNKPAATLEAIGFVELRPRLQGRQVGNLPVFGTLEGLACILSERHVRHLIVADPALEGAAFRWVHAVCRHQGVQVHRYVERLERCEAPLDTQAMAESIHLHANGNGASNGNGHAAHVAESHANGNGAAHANGNGHAAHGNGNGHAAHANGNGAVHANGNGHAAHTNGNGHAPHSNGVEATTETPAAAGTSRTI